VDVTVDFLLDGGQRTKVLQADLSSSQSRAATGEGGVTVRILEVQLPPTRAQRVQVKVSPPVAGISIGYSDRKPHWAPAAEFVLYPNYPNPFRDQTRIVVDIPAAEGDDPFGAQRMPRQIEVRIYNLLGQEVRRFSLEVGPGSRVPVPWDGRDFLGRPLPSGVYFYRIAEQGWQSPFRRALLLR